jgi:hypothetical protein
MDHGRHSGKQRLLIDFADDAAVIAVIWEGKIRPSTRDEYAATLRARNIDRRAGDILRRRQAAEA